MAEPSYDPEWYYKQNGITLGPISGLQLKELVSSGQLQPRQVVWKTGDRTLFFVCASRATLDIEASDGPDSVGSTRRIAALTRSVRGTAYDGTSEDRPRGTGGTQSLIARA